MKVKKKIFSIHNKVNNNINNNKIAKMISNNFHIFYKH